MGSPYTFKKSLKPTSLSFITISVELDKTKNLLLTITYEELAKPIHKSITEKLWLKYWVAFFLEFYEISSAI